MSLEQKNTSITRTELLDLLDRESSRLRRKINSDVPEFNNPAAPGVTRQWVLREVGHLHTRLKDILSTAPTEIRTGRELKPICEGIERAVQALINSIEARKPETGGRITTFNPKTLKCFTEPVRLLRSALRRARRSIEETHAIGEDQLQATRRLDPRSEVDARAVC